MLTQIAAHPWQDGGPPAFWPIFPILFWLAVGTAGFVLFRRRTAHPGAVHPQATARTILAERFARGEIDEEEYYTRMSVLRQEP